MDANPTRGAPIGQLRRRPLVLSAWAGLLAICVAGAPGLTPSVRAGDEPDRVGLEIYQPTPPSETEAQAFSDALEFAREHRDDLGYPWLDIATRTLEVSAATDRGAELLASTDKGGLRGGGVRHLRRVAASVADLDEIGNDVTRLAAQRVPNAKLIYRTEPDMEHNRIIITLSEDSDALAGELSRRFGAESIAIRINPDVVPVGTTGRQNDVSSFFGGALINVPVGTCTTGFSWNINGSSGMLTAAHCAPTGGSVSTPVQSMGSVRSASEENWTTGTGTVYYTGQTVYRGDVALIRIVSGRSSYPKIYRGVATSSTSSIVREMWSRSPVVNDAFCTGGAKSGELCAYSVTAVGINQWYILDGLGVWARNVVEGVRNNYTGCIQKGDSGGSVFTVRSDGAVAAKGIISGMGQTIGSCFVYFTDIRVAYFGLPGYLKTG